MAAIEIGIHANVRHAGQHLGNRTARRALHNRAQDFPVFGFRAAPVGGGDLFKRQNNVFIDITNNKICRHPSPHGCNR